MARGINTTGVPSVDTITLGSGKVFLAELDANGYPKKFEDIGEVKDFSTNLSAERLDYFSARSGVRTKKKSVVTQQDATLSFTIESMNFNNLARFYSGETEVYTNPAIAGVTDSRFVEDGDVEVNGYYQLRTASGVAYGITTANAIVVESTNATPVALVKDTDYTVNAVEGTIFLKDTATVQSIISAGDGLQFTLTADASATTVDAVNILSRTELNVAVMFVMEDADSGEKEIWDFHKVTLSSDGDHNLQSDEWQALPMTGSIEKNDAFVNYGTVRYPKTQG